MMTICATKLTPEVLLSAPRRSAGSPNSTGKLVLYTTSTYSFNDHKKTVQIHVLEVDSGRSTSLYRDSAYSEPTWVSETEFLLIRNGEKGTSSLLVADVNKPGATPQEISRFPGSIANLKVKQLSNGNTALACSAVVTPKGEMYSPEADKKSLTTAKVYTSLFARHWDSWLTENRNAIFYGSLKKTSSGSYALEAPGLVNVLKGTKLQSPVPPFGGTGDFDLGPAGLVFVALDPELSPALYTKSDLYFVPLRSFTEDTPPVPQIVKTGTLRGFSGAPTFSHSGNAVVFTRMRSDQYESDKTRLVLVPDIKDLANVQEFYATPDGEGGWDRRAESVLWSADDSELYVTAEDEGTTKLFRLPASPLAARELPQIISQIDGSINDVKPVQDAASSTDKLFISASSITDSSFYTTLDLSSSAKSASPTHTLVSSHSKQGRVFGLSRSQVSEIRFPGGGNGDYEVQAWVVKPSTFDPNSKTKYPLAVLIHGGPQSAWADSWSTRWHPAVFAEQGYVVVCPNPTGSTGFGMALQNGIRENWGGRPYEDIVACFDYVARTMGNVVDVDRAVALGASYGGYMVNWIQGHELGRRFKALVCHDGVFSTLNQYSSEELFFPIHDFGGQFWANRAGYEKWDPARFTNEWATPQLVIHNELDYRLPISEGLAAFNVLQSRGVPSKLLVFPDENHWVLKPENSLVWHKEVLGWINKYSGVGDDSSMSS